MMIVVMIVVMLIMVMVVCVMILVFVVVVIGIVLMPILLVGGYEVVRVVGVMGGGFPVVRRVLAIDWLRFLRLAKRLAFGIVRVGGGRMLRLGWFLGLVRRLRLAVGGVLRRLGSALSLLGHGLEPSHSGKDDSKFRRPFCCRRSRLFPRFAR